MIDKMDLNNKASSLRKKLGEDSESSVDIFNLVQKIENLTLVFYSLGENISGVCYKGKGSNVIAINSEMSLGRQRFSLAHELYHLYFDHSSIHSVSPALIGGGDETERKADQFASYFFIPPSSLYTMIEMIKEKREQSDSLTLEDVIKLEQYYGVSHKAMLYRLLSDGYLQSSQAKAMEVGVRATAAKLGYDTTLYRPSSEDRKEIVLGHYITAAEKLLEEDRISQGKYEGVLLDAFREDIVYGIGGEGETPLD